MSSRKRPDVAVLHPPPQTGLKAPVLVLHFLRLHRRRTRWDGQSGES
jgi:hypothetical protein